MLATLTRLEHRPCRERFGPVLPEALIAGTPVILPACGGLSDGNVEGVTGFAPVNEMVEALTPLLRELLDDHAQLIAIGKNAVEWALETFAPERYAQLVARRVL